MAQAAARDGSTDDVTKTSGGVIPDLRITTR